MAGIQLSKKHIGHYLSPLSLAFYSQRLVHTLLYVPRHLIEIRISNVAKASSLNGRELVPQLACVNVRLCL